jgi:TonB family protein
VHIKRWLAVRGAGQLLDWTVPRDLAQVAPEHFIRAPEEIRGLDKFRGEILPHPDDLRPLAREKESDVSAHERDDAWKRIAFNPERFALLGPLRFRIIRQMRFVLSPLIVLIAFFSGLRANEAGSSDWLTAPQPPYPLVSALNKTSGTVTLRLILKEDGRVKEVGIEKKSGSTRLDAAARMAALQWRLDPTKLKPLDTHKGRLVTMQFKRSERDLNVARAVLLAAGQRGSAWQIRGSIQFPSSARYFHREPGTVVIQFTVGFDCHPRAVTIIKSSGYPPFDQAAVEGIQTWKAYLQFVGESAIVPVTFSL